MYTQQSIEAVRAADIVSVISRFIKLDKHTKAACPFHDEKTSSFSVSPEKQIYKCFGCGEGGDALKFVMRYKNVDFPEAVKIIAEIEGITLEEEQQGDPELYKQKRDQAKSLRQILLQAWDLYKTSLWSIERDSPPWLYLQGRGYDQDIITHWGIGYAPNEWRLLVNLFKDTADIPKAMEIGICVDGEKSLYDTFRNRIIFPILDANGEIVTLGGRVLDDSRPKYINGSESPLYSKSKTLFGLYQAIPHIRKHGYAILVEGYTDVISMHMAGACNTVAPCGTALTEDQCKLLKRYTNTVVIMRDGDSAGLKAITKDINILTPLGIRTDIVELEAGQDPDDFAKEFILQSTT